MLDAYESTNGVIAPRSSLVTGYDFLADAATEVAAQLGAGTGSTVETLITNAGVSPGTVGDPPNASWTADHLRTKLFGPRHDVVFLAGHFSANNALAADFTSTIVTNELDESTANLTNSLVFSAGCHAGYNIVDADGILGVTQDLDWAQAFARKGATLVAGTGYQYGDTDFLEYSERLYTNFSRQLRAPGDPITHNVAVGDALVKAKQVYLADTPDIRGIHEKVLLEVDALRHADARRQHAAERAPAGAAPADRGHADPGDDGCRRASDGTRDVSALAADRMCCRRPRSPWSTSTVARQSTQSG